MVVNNKITPRRVSTDDDFPMDAQSAEAVASEVQNELPTRELVLVTIVVGLYIVLGEIDRLISRVSSQGYSASMADASLPRSPFPVPTAESPPWLTLHNLGSGADGFVWAFTVVDWGMAAAYGILLWGLLNALTLRRIIPDGAPVRLLTRPRPWLVVAAVAFDVVENIVLLAIVLTGSPRHRDELGRGVGRERRHTPEVGVVARGGRPAALRPRRHRAGKGMGRSLGAGVVQAEVLAGRGRAHRRAGTGTGSRDLRPTP